MDYRDALCIITGTDSDMVHSDHLVAGSGDTMKFAEFYWNPKSGYTETKLRKMFADSGRESRLLRVARREWLGELIMALPCSMCTPGTDHQAVFASRAAVQGAASSMLRRLERLGTFGIELSWCPTYIARQQEAAQRRHAEGCRRLERAAAKEAEDAAKLQELIQDAKPGTPLAMWFEIMGNVAPLSLKGQALIEQMVRIFGELEVRNYLVKSRDNTQSTTHAVRYFNAIANRRLSGKESKSDLLVYA